MEIKIKTGEELNKLLNALGREIVDANIYHQLLCDILSSQNDYRKAFNQSNTFWGLTIEALNDARIIRLCRTYDQEASSLNLVNLLHTIRANRHLFEEAHFRERLKDNAFVDSLAQTDRVPLIEKLDEDIEYASNRNPLVHKLMLWRGNIVAHRGAKISLGKTTHLENNLLSRADIEDLLNTGFTTFNRYSSLYGASTWSRQMIGHEDYKSLLRFVNLGLDKWEEDINREVH